MPAREPGAASQTQAPGSRRQQRRQGRRLTRHQHAAPPHAVEPARQQRQHDGARHSKRLRAAVVVGRQQWGASDGRGCSCLAAVASATAPCFQSASQHPLLRRPPASAHTRRSRRQPPPAAPGARSRRARRAAPPAAAACGEGRRAAAPRPPAAGRVAWRAEGDLSVSTRSPSINRRSGRQRRQRQVAPSAPARERQQRSVSIALRTLKGGRACQTVPASVRSTAKTDAATAALRSHLCGCRDCPPGVAGCEPAAGIARPTASAAPPLGISPGLDTQLDGPSRASQGRGVDQLICKPAFGSASAVPPRRRAPINAAAPSPAPELGSFVTSSPGLYRSHLSAASSELSRSTTAPMSSPPASASVSAGWRTLRSSSASSACRIFLTSTAVAAGALQARQAKGGRAGRLGGGTAMAPAGLPAACSMHPRLLEHAAGPCRLGQAPEHHHTHTPQRTGCAASRRPGRRRSRGPPPGGRQRAGWPRARRACSRG